MPYYHLWSQLPPHFSFLDHQRLDWDTSGLATQVLYKWVSKRVFAREVVRGCAGLSDTVFWSRSSKEYLCPEARSKTRAFPTGRSLGAGKKLQTYPSHSWLRGLSEELEVSLSSWKLNPLGKNNQQWATNTVTLILAILLIVLGFTQPLATYARTTIKLSSSF